MTYNRTTIRNIDPRVLREVKQIVQATPGDTMGAFFTDALDHYMSALPESNKGENYSLCERVA
ncbi:MAG: hypothetical protein AAF092_13415 [Pseudomonadota bacterium]